MNSADFALLYTSKRWRTVLPSVVTENETLVVVSRNRGKLPQREPTGPPPAPPKRPLHRHRRLIPPERRKAQHGAERMVDLRRISSHRSLDTSRVRNHTGCEHENERPRDQMDADTQLIHGGGSLHVDVREQ
eukprot:190758-Amorphochlora_amoeboformis.AAC.2